MIVVNMQNKLKCDFPGCKQLAITAICDENDRHKRLNLCDCCITNIYECIAKTVVPKSVESPFKKQKKLR